MASFGGHGMGGGQSSLDLDFDLLPQQQSSQQPLGGLSSINKLMMMDIFGNDAEELLKLLRSIGTFHKHLNFEVPLGYESFTMISSMDQFLLQNINNKKAYGWIVASASSDV
ncbi:hypothetical protein LINPERPRIM_LOCUS41227 [Linum perenne]